MTGPTMPGMVAKVLVIPSRMPAYLQHTPHSYCHLITKEQEEENAVQCRNSSTSGRGDDLSFDRREQKVIAFSSDSKT